MFLEKPPAFRPWRQDFYGAFFIACLILIFLHGKWTILMYLLQLIMLAAAWLLLKSGLIRLYGYKTEQRALKGLRARLPDVQINVPVSGAGDIDALYVRGSVCAAIEIKSWRTWQIKNGWNRSTPDNRTKKAVGQIKRLAERVKANQSIVWLPKATPFSIQYKGAWIIGGNAIYRHLSDLG